MTGLLQDYLRASAERDAEKVALLSGEERVTSRALATTGGQSVENGD